MSGIIIIDKDYVVNASQVETLKRHTHKDDLLLDIELKNKLEVFKFDDLETLNNYFDTISRMLKGDSVITSVNIKEGKRQ